MAIPQSRSVIAVLVSMFLAGCGCGRSPSAPLGTGGGGTQTATGAGGGVGGGAGVGGGGGGGGGEIATGGGAGGGDELALTIEMGPDQSLCTGASAEIGPVPVAGYTYAWTPSTGLSDPAAAQPVATPAQTTTYQLVVVDPVTGASGTARVTLFVSALPTASITGVPAHVCEGSQWTPSAAGSSAGEPGAQVASYRWEFGSQGSTAVSPTFTAEGTTALPVTLWVTDSNGCVGTVTQSVRLAQLPIANAGLDRQIGLGASTTIGQLPKGGTPPYSYSWTAAGACANGCLSDPTAAQPLVSPIADTRFTVEVADSLGCRSAPSTVRVRVGPALAANASPEQGICETQTATIGLPASGGTSPYQYEWRSSTCGPGCFSSTSLATISVTPPQTAVFTQKVTDQDRMVAYAETKVVVSPHPGLAGPDVASDPGDSVTIGPVPVGASTYAWSCNRPGCALSDPAIAQPLAAPTLSTRYTLEARNGSSCLAHSTKVVWVNLQPTSSPASGETAYPISARLQVHFDRPLLASTVTLANVRLDDALSGAAIPISVAYDRAAQVLTVTPPPAGTNGYEIGNDYTLTLAGAPAGILSEDPVLPNRLPFDVEIDFTTSPADNNSPFIVFRVPDDGATNVPTNVMILGVFSEPIEPATVSSATVSLRQGGAIVPGVVRYDFVTRAMTFVPAARLAPLTGYTVSILGVKDLSGNSGNFSWNFTTGSAPDFTPPTVVAISPLDHATGVPAGATIQVTYSEAIDPSTLGGGITLTRVATGAQVAGSASYNAQTRTSTFQPLKVLESQALYEVRVAGIRDLAGNTLAVPFLSRFTTSERLFFDDFESGTGKWNLPPTTGGLAWSTAVNQYRSATHSLTDSQGRKYQSNSTNVAELRNPITVNGLSFVSLQLALRVRAERYKDYFSIDYRLDGGAWVPINRPGTTSGWAGNLPWSTVTLWVPTEGATTLQLRLRFVSNATRNFDGVYVDDVLVQGQ